MRVGLSPEGPNACEIWLDACPASHRRVVQWVALRREAVHNAYCQRLGELPVLLWQPGLVEQRPRDILHSAYDVVQKRRLVFGAGRCHVVLDACRHHQRYGTVGCEVRVAVTHKSLDVKVALAIVVY